MKKNVIISLADSNYFELLNELIDSIKRFEESKNVAICILNAGLNVYFVELGTKDPSELGFEKIKRISKSGYCSFMRRCLVLSPIVNNPLVST